MDKPELESSWKQALTAMELRRIEWSNQNCNAQEMNQTTTSSNESKKKYQLQITIWLFERVDCEHVGPSQFLKNGCNTNLF